MNFKIIQPSQQLAPYVKNYWMLNACVSQHEPNLQRIVPSGFVELIFYYQDIPEYVRSKTTVKSNAIINGQQDEYYDIVVSGNLQLLSAVFFPQAARMFFGVPIKEFYNQSIPAELVFKDQIDQVSDKLNKSTSIEQRIDIVEDFLLHQITKNREFEIKRITSSVSDINNSKGVNEIEMLASNACLSRKQFERTFSDFVGIAPKKFMRIIRFQYALYTQQVKSTESLTQLAHECGYYDQSHMINDFKQLTGLTPHQYFNVCDPFSDYFS